MYYCAGECHFVCAVDSQRYLEQDRGWSDKKTQVERQKYGMAFLWYGMVWKYGCMEVWYGILMVLRYGSGVE